MITQLLPASNEMNTSSTSEESLSNNEANEQMSLYVKSQATETRMRQLLKAAASLTFFTILFVILAVFLYLIEDDYALLSVFIMIFDFIVFVCSIICWVRHVFYKKKLRLYTSLLREYERI
ncbi:Transmembrane domain-containing protein [Spironucleus salmonicida]|uniref:Transmembrane domain-containing protein n=1 Tax=Spironucleus salmonicida TaxID=348837 RepID=V6LKE5_9EUKA|nr:Transmembrane domain-containing protein [Spironucleus salmonicida]|eukprot:EST45115.1 Transmembrane domain-containing protein [Spironucleus salmonicida]